MSRLGPGLLAASTGLLTLAIPAQAQIPALLACPTQLEPMVTYLLQDLPSYTNRALTRADITDQFVMLASQPEFQPLSLGPGERASTLLPPQTDPYQVFFTTLSRNYQNAEIVPLQTYHWAFLTQSDSGWRLALLYSMIGPYPNQQGPATPPRETSDASVGQAIQTWLKDCRAGTLPPRQSNLVIPAS